MEPPPVKTEMDGSDLSRRPTCNRHSRQTQSQTQSLFFALPTEIRAMVYDNLLFDPHYTIAFWVPGSDMPRRKEVFEVDGEQYPRRRYPRLHRARRLQPAILETCQRIYAEALHSLYAKNDFWIGVPIATPHTDVGKCLDTDIPWHRFQRLGVAVLPDWFGSSYSVPDGRFIERKSLMQLSWKQVKCNYQLLRQRIDIPPRFVTLFEAMSNLKLVQFAIVDLNWQIIDVPRWYAAAVGLWFVLEPLLVLPDDVTIHVLGPNGVRKCVEHKPQSLAYCLSTATQEDHLGYLNNIIPTMLPKRLQPEVRRFMTQLASVEKQPAKVVSMTLKDLIAQVKKAS